jgi:hypothetical protein
MRSNKRIGAQTAALFVLFGCAHPVSAKAAPAVFKCLAANQSVGLKNYLVRLVTAAPSSESDSTRLLYQLPAGTASIVVNQTSRSLCTQAAQAYHNAIAPGTPHVSRTVAVYKVGTNRYVVLDPAEPYGEFQYHIVFDQSFTRLHAFAG